MSLEIIIGKNKTGKTHYLEKMIKEDDSILYIPAEINLDDTIKKENIGTTKAPNITPHWKVINFINSILFPNDLKLKLNDEQRKKVKESTEIIDNFNTNVNGLDDEFFEEYFKNILKVDEIVEIEISHNFIDKNVKNNTKGTSSGSLNYSLIKFLYELVSHKDFKLANKYKLIIDEIEKFSHPEMIFKIADMISDVSKKMEIIVTTHSPLFLERILFNHKNYLEKDKEFNVKYKISTKPEIELFLIDDQEISELLKKNNYREVSNLSKILFSSNIFLLEGINDQVLIYDLISTNDKYKNIYYTVIDCGGKQNIKKTYTNLQQLKIISFFNICLFYDLDKEEKFNFDDVVEIVNEPNLEERFFESENSEIKSDGNFVKKIKIKSGLRSKKDISATKKWILENTTKDNVDTDIAKLEKLIDDFFSKK